MQSTMNTNKNTSAPRFDPVVNIKQREGYLDIKVQVSEDCILDMPVLTEQESHALYRALRLLFTPEGGGDPQAHLSAYRPGDEFPNVGYVRRMKGGDL